MNKTVNPNLKNKSENLKKKIKKRKNKKDFKKKKKKLQNLLIKRNLRMIVLTVAVVEEEEAEVVGVEVITVADTPMIVPEQLKKTPELMLQMYIDPAQNLKEMTMMIFCIQLQVVLSPRSKSKNRAISSSMKTTTLHYE
jgi:transposase